MVILNMVLFSSKYRFKDNGGNFHIKLPVKDKIVQQVSVPEDLVQIQAYLRWERKGKQLYTPEQEKVSNQADVHMFKFFIEIDNSFLWFWINVQNLYCMVQV